MDYDSFGVFKGSLRINFQVSKDAEQAIKEFNGAELDGTTLKLEIRSWLFLYQFKSKLLL